ncbi:hypothetical protein ACFWVU_10655 [Streptomyces sp. NPDC058686]|uniref:hypothetical protein n=1 Tax=Streptomyces sp. NPDC058686 TaxID=3346599 RepID=UPI003647DCA3
MSITDIAELRAIGTKDAKALYDLMGIGWSTCHNQASEEVLRFENEKEGSLLETNSFIVTMNTGCDGMAADLAGAFRYGLKRELVTIEDLPEVFSPEILPIIKDVLRYCPLQWPDGEIQTPGERGIEI